MSVDTWSQRLHAEAFADGPPCADCGCADEVHCVGCKDTHTAGNCKRMCLECDRCEGYRPDDPRNHAPDDWEDE